MNKRLIWMISVLMALSVIGLLFIQVFYVRNVIEIHREQFGQNVRQSMIATVRHLDEEETRYLLEAKLDQVETSSLYTQMGNSLPFQEGLKLSFNTYSGLSADLTIKGAASEMAKIQNGGIFLGRRFLSMPETYRDHYLYQKGVLDDVVIDIISSATQRSIRERADSAVIESFLRERLDTTGIKLPFEFAVVNSAGIVQYKSAGYSPSTSADIFTQTLFPRTDSGDDRYFLKVYFPTKDHYLSGSAGYMIPAFVFTLILLGLSVYTIVVAFRQKKLSEMKTDFINNMTHEFKTPLSSISLAAQMLADPDIRKSPAMLQQLSQVVRDETKRLRFQVDKVLQMQMFERSQISMHLTEVDANATVHNIVNTFNLRVEKHGGKIKASLDAENAFVEVDEMHFTNVISTILDNAIKYRSEERPLQIKVESHNISDNRLEISIADNGIGIKKDYIKKVFDKFYRVPTGNVHDVKGFGLGLAYAKMIMTELGGSISVESEHNIGTKFIIILPLTND